jgi:hypothetical protein
MRPSNHGTATAGHKWLCAGFGAGFAFMRRALLARRPRVMGWFSTNDPFAFDNRHYSLLDSHARSELGCPPFGQIFALGAAVDFLAGIGRERIEARVLALNTYLTDGLDRIGVPTLSPRGAYRSAETLCVFPDPAHFVAHLAERGIHVSPKPQGIRVSTHFYNRPKTWTRSVACATTGRRSPPTGGAHHDDDDWSGLARAVFEAEMAVTAGAGLIPPPTRLALHPRDGTRAPRCPHCRHSAVDSSILRSDGYDASRRRPPSTVDASPLRRHSSERRGARRLLAAARRVVGVLGRGSTLITLTRAQSVHVFVVNHVVHHRGQLSVALRGGDVPSPTIRRALDAVRTRARRPQDHLGSTDPTERTALVTA